MIIKVKKLLIYGIKKDLSSFLIKAQTEGFIEFIGPSSPILLEFPSHLKNYTTAIKILKHQPVMKKKKEQIEMPIEKACNKIVQTKSNIDHLQELKNSLLEQAHMIAPFGEFSLKDFEYIEKNTNRIIQFFTIKTSKQKKFAMLEDLIYINTEYDLDYCIALNEEKKEYPGYIEVKIEQPINVIKKRINLIDEQIKKYHEDLKDFAFYLDHLKKKLLEEFNKYNLAKTQKDVRHDLEGTLFSVETWVPETKTQYLDVLIKEFSVDYQVVAIEEKDKMPTCIENNEMAKLGEDIIKIYDVPSTKDKDPSIWVLFAFCIFFAMIISDAGYGLLYLSLAIFLKTKFKKAKANMRRFTKLIFLLAISCIIWGVATTSFFGINFRPTSGVQKVSILNYFSQKKAQYHLTQKDDVFKQWQKNYPSIAKAKDGEDFLLRAKKQTDSKTTFEVLETFNQNILLEISLLIGTLHILLSFLRNMRKNIAGIGWICFLIGGYLYFPSFLNATSMVNFLNILPKPIAYFWGKHLVFIGIFLAVVLALIQKKKNGLKEITNVIGVFGDVLSYLRLYALGLAGSILSQTFNDIGSNLNIIIGIFVIIIGHIINIALGIIGGIIHGLRLNFLEWYNHCFEGGGKLFNPLRLFK